MSDPALEQRLRAAGRLLDASAPRFDSTSLAAPRRRRTGLLLVAALCAAAVAAVAAQPSALSSVTRFLHITAVDELRPVRGVAGPFRGERVTRAGAAGYVAFDVHEIGALGEPARFYGRIDVLGGMVSVVYPGGIVLTQWAAGDVAVRVEVVEARAVAEDVAVGPLPGVWVAGEARGTFAVTGADGERHYERFRVTDGALTWEAAGVGFLLSGARSKEEARRLAKSVS
jgi:hypothetical protein